MNLFAQFLLILPLVFGLTGAQSSAPLRVSINADVFEVSELFDASWAAGQGSGVACKTFRAGVVNHHALASDLLAGFFSTLKRCQPGISHFIILSPDHFSQAHASVATHELAYRANGLEIKADVSSTERLLHALPFAVDQPSMFEREHGVGALIPFLAHEFPHARVTTVAVKSSISVVERGSLATWLKVELKNPDTFVIVSSDMSHYLNERQALANDQATERAFSQNDQAFFASTNDDFSDNGPSIAAALRALGKTKWTLMQESISSAHGGSPGFTTSYLVGFWE